MNGQDMLDRIQRKECIECGRDISARKPDANTGFLPHECAICEAKPKPRKPHFNHKAEREAGIQNLRNLGA